MANEGAQAVSGAVLREDKMTDKEAEEIAERVADFLDENGCNFEMGGAAKYDKWFMPRLIALIQGRDPEET